MSLDNNDPLELKISDEVFLRRFSIGDAESIFSLIEDNREHFSQYGDDTSSKYPNLEIVVRSIENPTNPNKIRMGIWLNGQYTGTINLNPSSDNQKVEIGFYLGKEFLGRGLMKMAVNAMTRYAFENGFRKVNALVDSENVSSQTLLGRCGYIEKKKISKWG